LLFWSGQAAAPTKTRIASAMVLSNA